MIQDKVRTATYASFIQSNTEIFRDAIVMDVGCGTGILSLFAAQAGAKHVYAVDASDIAEKAEQIVKDNKVDQVITCAPYFKQFLSFVLLSDKRFLVSFGER